MSRTEAFLLSLSILIPMIAGLVRYRSVPVSYRPFIYLLFIGFANEIVSYFFFYNSSNAVPTNIYFLCEFLLFTIQFRLWKNILKKDMVYRSVLIGMTTLWIVENIVLGKIGTFSPTFQIGYSFVLVLMAVNQVNWLVVNEKGNLTTNAIFIISVAVMIFFSYKVLTEVFYYYATDGKLQRNIFTIEVYLNVVYNILLAIAILCMPRKKNFTRQLL